MFRIKKLDIFIIKQFSLLFAGTFFISLFVLMMQFLWRYVNILIGKGLSMEILGQFFWYMSLIMIPKALPLAILLSSLITYGNLGESSELTAIKSSGISLMKSFRGLIIVTSLVALGSFYFQNNIGPDAQKHMAQLFISMKQKNPELEIPEGVFYDGIPQTNLYVEKKDLQTGHLYNIMVYRMTDSYEDQAIILADSGMLQSTAEKKHLVMTLWNGEWFENMRSQEMGNSATIPYRRETFINKKIIIDFDADFNLTDMAGISSNASTKSISKIKTDKDSLIHVYDSIGDAFYKEAQGMYYPIQHLKPKELATIKKNLEKNSLNIDSVYGKLRPDERRMVVDRALSTVQQEISDLDFKSMITSDGDKMIRQHQIEVISKYLLALTCIIFFFIGAPLGAIIRKGGLGVPIIISVLVFIIYYILDNTGEKMAKQGDWAIWFGRGLSPAILIPTAIFFTYKANNDSAVFNIDLYRNMIMRMLGLRIKRHINGKEVILKSPDYLKATTLLTDINNAVTNYAKKKNLKSPPNIINTFFKYQPDHEIERINNQMEDVIEDLGNTRSRAILTEINKYPILIVKAHTRPFERKWMNITAAILFPAGLFFYFRMWRFRLRLYRDLKTIKEVNENIISEIEKLNAEEKSR
ncbi:YjgP/YjgQ family permease [Prevotella brunnea]|uniref:YjgP/YjgQ family permease n=1 Tax=Prevotella brunnea TaxID=2508867 RepID=A0A5C8GP37_9BACT|nr:LptF/LptG family permease [Prevotella brunnea]TXJ62692.1 YjgP/YjgQ family permease [Prevotella brunnea]